MEKFNPVKMRKCLEIVHLLKDAGIPFCPMPILNEVEGAGGKINDTA